PMKSLKKMLGIAAIAAVTTLSVKAQSTLRVGVAGLNHDHIYNILNDYKKGRVNLVGIAEPNKHLWEKFGKQFHIPDSIFFTDLKTMVAKRKPGIVLGYNAVGNHVDVVEVCAPLHIPVMVEKPLAATLVQAKRIEELANKYNVKVLVNYETTWYPSNRYIYNKVADS